MRNAATAVAVLATALVGGACGSRGPKGPDRAVLTSLLQKEADSLKADGEKMDPVLRVKATWTVEGIDLTERPGDDTQPWAGVIRFRIKSETRDADGSVATDEFEKRFNYVYNTTLDRWIFQYEPTPKPAAPR
jgi:hypothetical protein